MCRAYRLLYDSNWQFPTVAQAAFRLQLSVEVFSCDYKLHALVIMPSYARAHQVTQHACHSPLSLSLSHNLFDCSVSVPGIEIPASASRMQVRFSTSAPQSQSQNAILAFNWPWKHAGRAVAANQLTKLADWLFVCCIAAVVALQIPCRVWFLAVNWSSCKIDRYCNW